MCNGNVTPGVLEEVDDIIVCPVWSDISVCQSIFVCCGKIFLGNILMLVVHVVVTASPGGHCERSVQSPLIEHIRAMVLWVCIDRGKVCSKVELCPQGLLVMAVLISLSLVMREAAKLLITISTVAKVTRFNPSC